MCFINDLLLSLLDLMAINNCFIIIVVVVVICRPNINMILLSGLPHICPSAPNEAVEQEVCFLGRKRSG